MKKKRAIDLIFTVICAVLVLSIGVGIFAFPRAAFSEAENRSLATMPPISWRSLASGEYFAALSLFCSDHIPLRQTLVRGKALCELWLGKLQNNGVIFLDSGALVDRCEYDSDKILTKNLDGISSVVSERAAVVMAVPRSIDVMPALYRSEDAEAVINTIRAAGLFNDSLLSALSLANTSGEKVYYKTDHHLTAHGAYILYTQLAAAVGIEPYPKSDFTPQTVSEDFLGSIYSRSGMLATSYDTVELYRYEGDEEYTVTCEDGACSLSDFYELSALEKKDKYLVFLGGNHGVLRVSSDVDKPDMLLIKDSFANAVIPLLARSFDLTVIDPRYASAASDLPDGEFDYTVILMGVDTLATVGIRWETVLK